MRTVGQKHGSVCITHTHTPKYLRFNLLIELHSFSANYEENESRGWYCALLSATGIQYVLSVAGIVLLYIYYDCPLNRFFITFNMILCIIVSILSIMPQVQERISRSGLLQSSVVTLYVIYLTWSALSNNPDGKCHSDISHGSSKVILRLFI